jgi:hypothetical protein
MVMVEQIYLKNILNQYSNHFLCHFIDEKSAKTWEVTEFHKAYILSMGSSSFEVRF